MRATKFSCLLLVCLSAALLLQPQEARAHPLAAVASWAASAARWAGSYLLGKGVDHFWDKATGKPDVGGLNHRLAAVEKGLASDPALATPIRELRKQITPDTSFAEYSRLAQKAMKDLERRVEDLERRVNDIERRLKEHDEVLRDIQKRLEENARPANYEEDLEVLRKLNERIRER